MATRKFRSKALSAGIAADNAPPEICLLRTFYCLPFTYDIAAWRLDGEEFGTENYLSHLAELKADLQAGLAALSAHEKTIAKPLTEASRLYADELEAGLTDALKQVAKLKQEL